MTIAELKDKLDHFIKHDLPDTWQLNDVELDAQMYKERCEERGQQEIVVSNGNEHFKIVNAFTNSENAFEIIVSKEQ